MRASTRVHWSSAQLSARCQWFQRTGSVTLQASRTTCGSTYPQVPLALVASNGMAPAATVRPCIPCFSQTCTYSPRVHVCGLSIGLTQKFGFEEDACIGDKIRKMRYWLARWRTMSQPCVKPWRNSRCMQERPARVRRSFSAAQLTKQPCRSSIEALPRDGQQVPIGRQARNHHTAGC